MMQDRANGTSAQNRPFSAIDRAIVTIWKANRKMYPGFRMVPV